MFAKVKVKVKVVAKGYSHFNSLFQKLISFSFIANQPMVTFCQNTVIQNCLCLWQKMKCLLLIHVYK